MNFVARGRIITPQNLLFRRDELYAKLMSNEKVAVRQQYSVADLSLPLRVVVAPVDFAASNQKNLTVMRFACIEKVVAGKALSWKRYRGRERRRYLCLHSGRTQNDKDRAERSG